MKPERVLLKRKNCLFSLFRIALVELVNSSGNVNQLLFAGEEGMAVGADTDFIFFSCGLDVPDFATGADYFCRAIIRMNVTFHFTNSANVIILNACYFQLPRGAISKMIHS